MRALSWLVLAAVVAASAAFVYGTAGQLPLQVTSHFGPGGRANGWMTRDAYLVSWLAMTVGIPLVVAAMLSVAPCLLQRGLSIPNRDYWLEKNRRSRTLATLGVFGCALGCVLALFFAALHYTILQANASAPPRLPTALFFGLLAAFFVAMLAWVAALHLRFRNRR